MAVREAGEGILNGVGYKLGLNCRFADELGEGNAPQATAIMRRLEGFKRSCLFGGSRSIFYSNLFSG
jgi:hypothetical protein